MMQGLPGLDVLFVSSDARPLRGGVARCLDGWLTGLSELGYRAGILSLLPPAILEIAPGPRREYREWFIPRPDRLPSRADAAVPVRKLRTAVFMLLHHLRVHRKIAHMIRSLQPTRVVLGSTDTDSLYVLRQSANLGTSNAVVCYGAELRPSAMALAPFRSEVLRRADRILAISQFTRDIVRQLPSGRRDVSIVSPSLATETEHLWGGESVQTEKDPSVLRLATVARLVERKGVQHTLEALALLRQRGIDARLQIVGTGEFESILREHTSRLGMEPYVSFLGDLSDRDTAQVVRGADLFVLTPYESEPGNVEGFGLAYLEAGALGIPVVGSRSGGVPEAVWESQTGLLVDPGVPQKTAQAIEQLWRAESERRRLGVSGRERARANWPAAAAATLAQALELPPR